MSVPPPSCTPNRTSTGSWRTGVRSVIDVSKATSEVRRAGSWASTAPNSDAYTTLSAIRPRLVDGDHDVLGEAALPASEADQTFGDDGVVLGLVVPEVGVHGAEPVDVAGAGPATPVGPGERTVHGRTRPVGEPLLQLGEDPGDDVAGGRSRLVGQEVVELDQHGDQVVVGFDRLEQLGFEQELPEVEPLDRVPLHDLDDRLGEVRPDVAEPAGHAGRRPAKTSRTPTPPPAPTLLGLLVVDRAHRGVDAHVVTGEPGTRPVRLTAAQHQPPPPHPLGLRDPRPIGGRRPAHVPTSS